MQCSSEARLPADAFLSIAKLRLKEPVRRARSVGKDFANNVTKETLNDAVSASVEAIENVFNLARSNLDVIQESGFLAITNGLIQNILNVARTPKYINVLGKDVVIGVINKYLALIDALLSDLETNIAAPSWVNGFDLDDLCHAYHRTATVFRRKLSNHESSGHHKLLLLKSDLLRYRSKMQPNDSVDLAKFYWLAYAFAPEQGSPLNQLAIVSMNGDTRFRIESLFYFCRAAFASSPFEGAKDTIQTKLGEASQRFLKSGYLKLVKLFEDITLTDSQGIEASAIGSLSSQDYYFAWFTSRRFPEPKWHAGLKKLKEKDVQKIINDIFIHSMNLIIHRYSHDSLSSCLDWFMAVVDFAIDESMVPSKTLIHILIIFMYAINSYDSCSLHSDSLYRTLCVTMISFVGLLMSKVANSLLSEAKDGNLAVDSTAAKLLPSLVVLGVYWPNLAAFIPPGTSFVSSALVDFAAVQKTVATLFLTVKSYLEDWKARVRRLSSDDPSDGIVLPELIYFCFGSKTKLEYSLLSVSVRGSGSNPGFDTYLARIWVLSDLLQKMAKRNLFGLKEDFTIQHPQLALSSFERFACKGEQVLVTYPEYLVIDTNVMIDEYPRIVELTALNMKIALPCIVLSELRGITKFNQKSTEVRDGASKALEVITSNFDNGSGSIQIVNYYGERKFDFDIRSRDLYGMVDPYDLDRQVENNDDQILTVCSNLEGLLEPTSHRHGFQSQKIQVRKVILLTGDRIMRIKARTSGIVACSFQEFFTWVQECRVR